MESAIWPLEKLQNVEIPVQIIRRRRWQLIMEGDTVLVAADVLIEACQQVLAKAGVPRGQAEMIAQVVVEGDLRGVGSHGVLRLPAYVHRVQAGLMTAATEVKVVQRRGGTALLDAQAGFGQGAGIHAMNHAIEGARKHGVGVVAVRNANHIGIAAYYAMMALPHKMIGMATTNAAPSMAAWGGTAAVLGTNPICVAIPTGQDVDIVLDMASSIVARGKIRFAASKGDRIPLFIAVQGSEVVGITIRITAIPEEIRMSLYHPR